MQSACENFLDRLKYPYEFFEIYSNYSCLTLESSWSCVRKSLRYSSYLLIWTKRIQGGHALPNKQAFHIWITRDQRYHFRGLLRCIIHSILLNGSIVHRKKAHRFIISASLRIYRHAQEHLMGVQASNFECNIHVLMRFGCRCLD